MKLDILEKYSYSILFLESNKESVNIQKKGKKRNFLHTIGDTKKHYIKQTVKVQLIRYVINPHYGTFNFCKRGSL